MTELSQQSPQHSPRRVAEISAQAVRHNVARVREVTGGKIIAVVKANGYGHGAAVVARAFEDAGVDMLGVVDVREALELRAQGIRAPILCWLHGPRTDFAEAIRAGIDIGLGSLSELAAVERAAQATGVAATVQLEIDSGLSRGGAAAENLPALCARLAELQGLGRIRVNGIFSHLANTSPESDKKQADRFADAISVLRAVGVDPPLKHLAASAATFSSPHLHFNAVRVGLALYGLSPTPAHSSADLGLRPVLTLKSEIIGLRRVRKGAGVSYEHTFIAPRDMTLGLVPVGYADGLPRLLSGSGASVVIDHQQYPIVGRVSMDQIVIDLRGNERQVGLGNEVTLFGDPETGVPAAEAWAQRAHTISYEIVTGLGNRVERQLVSADTPVHTRRITVANPDDMHAGGVRLGELLQAGDLVLVRGPLGAGKTTLTRGIGEGMGVRGRVTSPTFVIARTHQSLADGPPLTHVDAYRLENADELDDLDLDFTGSAVVVEWPDNKLLSREDRLEITIERPLGALEKEHTDDDETVIEPRLVTVTAFGERWRDLGELW